MPDMDASIPKFVVEHPGVDGLAGEGDPDPRPRRVGVDRRAAGGEQDRARAAFEHRPDHGRNRGDGTEHADLQRRADVV